MNRALPFVVTIAFILSFIHIGCGLKADLAASSVPAEDLTTKNSTDLLRAKIVEMEKALQTKEVDLDKRWENDRQINEKGAMDAFLANGQQANTEAIWNEIVSRETDIDNLIKDGFEENHPRCMALRMTNARRFQQIRDMVGSRYLQASVPYPAASLQIQKDFLTSLDQLIALNHRYQALVAKGPPFAGHVNSETVPSKIP